MIEEANSNVAGEEGGSSPSDPTGYKTTDYVLVITEGDEGKVYQVNNIAFNVIEYEDHFLPRTIHTMMDLQKHLNEVKARYWRGTVALIDGEGNDEPIQGDPGLH